MDIAERIAGCAGLDVAEIGERFVDDDQDEITRALVEEMAARTDRAELPSLPYRVAFTLYGDADVSEWVLVYDEVGHDVVAGRGHGEVDIATRWEHWEDAVRLLNGDVSPLSLLFSLRIGLPELPEQEPEWFRAVRFAPMSTADEHDRLLAGLVEARLQGRRELAAYVEREGIERLSQARALVVARTLIEAGSGEELAGSYLRMVVPAEPQVVVQVEFAATAVATSVSSLASEPPASEEDRGVTLRYSTVDALVSAASGEAQFQQLVVNGQIRVEGPDERLEAFGRALWQFAQLFATT